MLVLGEPGAGKTVLGNRLAAELKTTYSIAHASYTGALKAALLSIAKQLDIPTTTPTYNKDGEQIGEKPMSADQLREEIASNCDSSTLIICDSTERWSASLRYWLEGLHNQGVVLLLLASRNPERDIFLKMPVLLQLEAVPELEMRQLIDYEAQRQELRLSTQQLANVTSRAGGNITRAKYLVQQLRLGEESEVFKSANQYRSITPFLMAALAAFSILRYLANGDPALRLIGGAALVLYIVLRQLGRA